MSILGRAAFIAVVVLGSASCNKSSPSTGPTPPAGPLAISGLQAQPLGLLHQVCNVPFEYTAVDQLVFDVSAGASSVVGATVVHEEEGKQPVTLGAVTQCPPTITPCSSTSVCVTASTETSTKVRIYTRVPWSPQWTWNLAVQTQSGKSNLLNALLTRPEQLPAGTLAGIADLSAQRTSQTAGTYRVVVYSPGVAGRFILISTEVYLGAQLLSTKTVTFNEAPERQIETDSGSLTLPQAEATVTVFLQERDAAGALLARDTKSVIVR